MKNKRNAFGGNGDIYFSDDNLTATKILRNRSSIEKIERFKREVEVMNALASKHIPNIVDIISFEQEQIGDTCVCCGKKANKMLYWGKAY